MGTRHQTIEPPYPMQGAIKAPKTFNIRKANQIIDNIINPPTQLSRFVTPNQASLIEDASSAAQAY